MVAPRKPPRMFMGAPAAQQATQPAGMFAAPLRQREKQPFDWASLLQGVGAGLLTGRNIGEGLGQGLVYARQFGDQRADNERLQRRDDREEERYLYGRIKDQQATTQAAAEKAARDAAIDQLPIDDAVKAALKASDAMPSYGDLVPKAKDPNLTTFYDGDQQYQGYLGPDNQPVRVTENSPRWAPQQPAAPVSTNLITLVSPDGKAQRSVDSRDPNLKGLIEQGWIERQTSMFPAAPSGYRYTKTGNLEAIPQGPADPANPNNITGDQRKVASFAERLESANKIIDENEGAGTSYVQEGLSSVPLVGTMLASEPKQKLTQAQRDFINAQLRRESGATIQATEFDSAAKQYFPQPGEGPEIVAQKKEARRIAIENMKREAGAALPKGGANPDDPLGILD